MFSFKYDYWLIVREEHQLKKKIKTNHMLKLAIIFLILAVVAAVFGFTDISANTAPIAKTVFFVSLALVNVSGVLGLTDIKKV